MGVSVEILVSVNGQPCRAAANSTVPILCAVGSIQHVKFVVANKSKEEITFKSYEHGYRARHKRVGITIKDEHGVPWVLPPSGSCFVKMDLEARESGGQRIPITFTFRVNGGATQQEVLYLVYDCIAQGEREKRLFEKLAPVTDLPTVDEATEQIISGLKLVPCQTGGMKSALEYTLDLDDYEYDEDIAKLVLAPNTPDKLNNIRDKLNISSLSYQNYSEFYNQLLDMEEVQHWSDVMHYTIRSSRLYKDRQPDRQGNTRFRLQVPGLAEKRPSVLRGDRLYVVPLPPDRFKYEGLVDDTSQNNAYLVFSPRFEDDVDVENIRNMEFRIEFNIDRFSLRLMHRAVDIMQTENYFEKVLFPVSCPRNSSRADKLEISCYERRVEDNEEQLKAIKHIVCGTSKPAPYLIYGPPGTGKTFTLVEAIKQVCKNCVGSKVLVCAPQNDAADLIAERLLDHIPDEYVMRFNASSRSYESLSEKIRKISNYSRVEDHAYYPPKEVLAKKRIIISTLVTSGRLVSAEMTDHFTHIFIDEAGHASEPETVIPIGLLSKGGQLVLAGDPKQLGPVMRSDLAKAHGLGKSLLERLMGTEGGLYTRGEHSTYDYNFVTKLLQNFRSHTQILEVPNQRFYEFELVPCAEKMEIEKFCGWKHLPDFARIPWEYDNKGFPLIFRQVVGREEQDRSSPSWFNRHEVLVVAEYVELLLRSTDPIIQAKDIGIISPYIQQVRKIRTALKEIDGLDGEADVREIRVGSVEKFQGDERDVIIISTVRSQPEKMSQDRKFNLGFVSNAKRFNVAVTRAKSLLIVIGNPEVLCTDENWRRLVDHITKGGGYMGDNLDEEMLRIEEDVIDELDSLSIQDLPEGNAGKSTHLLYRDDEYGRRD